MSRSVTPNKEDYLERIHELIQLKGYARVADIAAVLNFKRPSVTLMIQQLSREGYLNYQKYRGLTLTSLGQEVAERIRNRHMMLTELFSLLGVDAETAYKDLEGIEHHLSETTFKRLQDLVEHLKKHPLPITKPVRKSGKDKMAKISVNA